MTNLATALAPNVLPPYCGQTVARTTISIRNAGDGLSEGLGIEPQLLGIGDRVYVVLECVVDAHDHKRLKGAPDLLVLDQVLKAGTGTLIDADVVVEAIEQQALRIDAAKEAAAKAEGKYPLPYTDAAALGLAHDAGEHAGGLVEGCPTCGDEVQAAADEAEEADQPAPTPIAGRRKKAGS